jgi:carbon monoxide dehydrogenase subunit G
MDTFKQVLAALGLVCLMWLLSGCAQVLVPGAFTGAGEIYHYNTDNVVKKNLMGDVGQVKKATRGALKKMDVDFHSMNTAGYETEIEASTTELDITITIEPVTSATTRVKVDAVADEVFKDRATAAHILSQIEAELYRKPQPENKFPRVFIQNDCHRGIDVIVYYLDGKNGPTAWQTRGWFSVDPGKQKHVVDTHNRYVYFYAETPSGKKKIWTGDLPQWFEGRRYQFFKVDMGTNLEDFTYAFSCN